MRRLGVEGCGGKCEHRGGMRDKEAKVRRCGEEGCGGKCGRVGGVRGEKVRVYGCGEEGCGTMCGCVGSTVMVLPLLRPPPFTHGPYLPPLPLSTQVIRCMTPVSIQDCVLGQYVAGNGNPGYLDDPTVPKGSK